MKGIIADFNQLEQSETDSTPRNDISQNCHLAEMDVREVVSLNQSIKKSSGHSHRGRYFTLSFNKFNLSVIAVLACFLLAKPCYLYTKSVVAQILLHHSWQKSLVSGEKSLPWAWSDSYPVAKLTNVKSQESWVILSGMTGRAMAFAPTWQEDSALPNEYGNTVISAHNDTHFRDLQSIELGEKFLLEDINGRVVVYRTISIEVVSLNDISPYLVQDATMITLITCYPFEPTNTDKKERLVIRAIKDDG